MDLAGKSKWAVDLAGTSPEKDEDAAGVEGEAGEAGGGRIRPRGTHSRPDLAGVGWGGELRGEGGCRRRRGGRAAAREGGTGSGRAGSRAAQGSMEAGRTARAAGGGWRRRETRPGEAALGRRMAAPVAGMRWRARRRTGAGRRRQRRDRARGGPAMGLAGPCSGRQRETGGGVRVDGARRRTCPVAAEGDFFRVRGI